MRGKASKPTKHRKRHLGRDMAASLRQAAFPGPIRIARSSYDEEWDALVDQFLAQAQARSEAVEVDAPVDAHPAKPTGKRGEATALEDFFHGQMELMMRVGTSLWRLRQKSQKADTPVPANDAQRSQRHLESVWQAIADAGFMIQDHTNQAYDPRMALHVVSIEPTAGQVGEVVMETLKPSIYYKDRCIQMGEVIIAVPEDTESPPDGMHSAKG